LEVTAHATDAEFILLLVDAKIQSFRFLLEVFVFVSLHYIGWNQLVVRLR
jgi:hypothetical protein